MTTLNTIVLVVHVLIALSIILLVLLQRGKGAEAGAAFGAGASGTVFGARGSANFLSRSTAVLATLFFVTSLGLAYLAGQRKPVESLIELTEPSAVLEPSEAAPPEQAGAESGLPELPAIEPEQPASGAAGADES